MVHEQSVSADNPSGTNSRFLYEAPQEETIERASRRRTTQRGVMRRVQSPARSTGSMGYAISAPPPKGVNHVDS
jgi:hypothetical protein